jgi:phosphoglucomutase
MWFAF